MEELIARRQFEPLYIWLDIAFLCVFLALLLWKRKYMTVLVGLRNFMMYGRYVYADEIKIPDGPRILLFWTLFIGVGAVAGAAGMLLDPSGRALGMDAMLPYFQVLPFADVLFRDLTFSGWALLIVNGLTNLTAASLLLAKKNAGITLGGLFGVTLMPWIRIQFYMFPPNFMSTIYFMFGFAQAAPVRARRSAIITGKIPVPARRRSSRRQPGTDLRRTMRRRYPIPARQDPRWESLWRGQWTGRS